ncbi:hypothetical protein HanRHA438_Chr03g0120301 [Helianthus annuus]|uniref:DUF4408 domain-containing protein n=1 Tax=Helianthus annuus TaxID=4232 RepID=A0A9K3JFP3_HELAN|nr:uncharacterized protein LOC110931890 [Helianthus annuus]KAF5814305.1 hypothetical protein HanXRQr2_Chr03g0109531 [Helianthus annuus]KAJ0592947.1 hypothetical protein HanHA300_Chr03g0091521 [Helianthus annuus]KAJ0607950.1 hypothetical protein HanHA89_Chr03g0103161 [Helianthus annuus]KAJ0768016.1 hypothetical protein HanLR1_Chr03g0096551 [Helianthus annuus]KAJ0935506.1 hypothetical protein HanRHA438_Chr03g0120301 [Helianthus annuus]
MSKTTAILNNHRLHKITTLIRFTETFFLLIIISNFSSQLPSTLKLAGDYLHSSSLTIFTPKFVFLIGNLIILILFLRSRVVEHVEHKDEIGDGDMCYEYVKMCDQSVVSAPVNVGVVSDDVRICRSKSENLMSVRGGKRRELRRSVTEIGLKSDGDNGRAAVKEELSCEDFRRTVEAFIARQQKILRDEELSPVV